MKPTNNELPEWLQQIPEERREDAEESMRQYLSLALRIFARLEAEEAARALTVVEYGPTLNDERSNQINHLEK